MGEAHDHALDAVESAIAWEAAHRGLNSFIQIDPPRARAQAATAPNGPLQGFVFSVKDNLDVAGWRTTGGTPGLSAWRPASTASVVQRLFDAGGVLLGKNNMHELAAGITSANATYGPVRNPVAPDLIAGGSSGGGAVAVAAGIVRFALGTDTAGSCRIPAALCGCVGFRPSLDRYPADGLLPLCRSRDTVGVFTRSIADLRVVDAVCAGGPQPQSDPIALPGLRLGVPETWFYEDLEAGLEVVVRAALARLSASGAELVRVEVENVGPLTEAMSLALMAFEGPRDIAMYLEGHASPVRLSTLVEAVADPMVRGMLKMQLAGHGVTPAQHRAALAGREALRSAYRRCTAAHGLDAFVVPTTRLTARPVGQHDVVSIDGIQVPTLAAYLRNTDPSSCAGLASVTLPIGLTHDRLPVGLSLEGLEGSDQRLLRIAGAVEAALRGPAK